MNTRGMSSPQAYRAMKAARNAEKEKTLRLRQVMLARKKVHHVEEPRSSVLDRVKSTLFKGRE